MSSLKIWLNGKVRFFCSLIASHKNQKKCQRVYNDYQYALGSVLLTKFPVFNSTADGLLLS